MKWRQVWRLLRQTAIAWNEHEATRFGASLAFYALLSLAPLVILVVAAAALFVSFSTAQHQVMLQFIDLVGPEGAAAIRGLIVRAQSVHAGSAASIVAIFALLFGASQVFVELKSALDRIWSADSAQSRGVLAFIRTRFVSFGLVLGIGLLLLASLLVSALLSVIGAPLDQIIHMPEWLLRGFDFLLSVMVTSVLFAMIFEYIPNAKVSWRHAWIGGLTTAGLFSLGKALIGLYLGKAAIGSVYGAAGSLVVIVVWVYYSSQIFLFGAELTHVLGKDVLDQNKATTTTAGT